ncbi:hypothetical protein [Thioalkalivibrio sp.]|uniref:hypothetical protein n=1 Tax=Thioalkalivibrio sp. TaxID=2093813 RepID=UPI0012D699A2|nr:hypothetical protein [Thioalkalivibrio sp.]TVP83697.1 MAG: hypothetical protein EA346_00360 [Thioalkalivibrio sp.]
MASPFPHPPASRTAALERRLRAQGRALEVLIPRRSASHPRLLDHLRATFVHPMDPGGTAAPDRGPGDRTDGSVRTGITERNGIWVLTVGGVWRGDYRTRAQAEAAADRAQQQRA